MAFDSWQASLDNPNVIGDFVWTAMDYLGESGLGRFAVSQEMMPPSPDWPWLTAHCGDLDLIGSKRSQGHYRDVVWQRDQTPRLFVLPPALTGRRLARMSWTWEPVEPCYTYPGQEGHPIEAHIYADADEVELWQNGVSLGRLPVGKAEQRRAVFTLTYQPGSLEAVALTNGRICGRTVLLTEEATAGLTLSADRATIRADGYDLCFIKIQAITASGVVNYREQGILQVTLAGSELVALGNADPKPDRLLPFRGTVCPLYQGEALAVVRSRVGEGGCRLTATLAEHRLISEIKLGIFDLPIRDLLTDPRQARIIERHLSDLLKHPMFNKMSGMSLKKLAGMGSPLLDSRLLEDQSSKAAQCLKRCL